MGNAVATSPAWLKIREGQTFFFSSPPDLPQAIACFSEATKIDPDLSEGFVWLANAMAEQSKNAQAIAFYNKAIELDPNDPRSRISLGVVLEQVGHLDEAVKRFREGLSLKPHYCEADTRVMLAKVLKRLGKNDEAIAEWDKVANMTGCYPSYEDPINEAKLALQKLGLG